MLPIIIAYLGLYVGIFLGWLSPEEMKPGKKYFEILQRTLFALIGGVFLYLFTGSLIVALISVLLVFFPFHLFAIYLLFPLLFYYAPNIGLLALFFLYGLPAGSGMVKPYVDSKNKNSRSLLQLMLIALKESWVFFASFGAYLILAFI
jgi:hypothetical protein